MNPLQALSYGVVQGLGEFLPISSSAHLTILPWLMGWEDPGLAFDVALHVGTLLALLIYFRAELVRLARGLVAGGPDRQLALLIIVGSLPGAAIGYLLEKRAEDTFRDPRIIAVAMLVMGILLYAIDRAAAQARSIDRLSLVDAVLIGLAQSLAIIPGVSRSGSTITAGRAARLDREAAARFSFLLAIPITAGAALLKVPKLLHERGDKTALAIAVVAAAVSGYLALDLLLRWVRTKSYLPFVIYRVLFAAAVLAIFYARAH
jgi:undecaprenyl-diphosphatase